MKSKTLKSSGNVSWLSKQDGPVQIDYTTPLEGADNDGWLPAMETDGEPRVWDTDRIVEGYISSERLDNQKDIVPLEAFTVKTDATGEMPLIEWIAKNAELMWVHGKTEKGALAIGRAIGYKVEDGKPKFRWGIKKGSPLIDACWETMKQNGTAAGFSIGGAKIEQECDDNNVCTLHKLDVPEVSYAPDPAQKDAVATYINKLAKEDDEVTEDEDEADLEKPCPWSKRAAAIKASNMADEYKTELLAVIKQREPQSNAATWKLPHDRQERELDAIKPMKLGEEEDEEEETEKSQSSGDEHGPSVTTRKGDNNMEDEKTEPLEKADAILAGLGELKKSVDALVKALIKQEEEDKEPPKKDEEEDDKDAEKQDEEEDKKEPAEEEDKKDEEKSVKKASDAELLGAVIERGLASKLQDLQKGGAARPTGTGQPLAKTDGDDSYGRRLKGRIARAEKLQGA